MMFVETFEHRNRFSQSDYMKYTGNPYTALLMNLGLTRKIYNLECWKICMDAFTVCYRGLNWLMKIVLF